MTPATISVQLKRIFAISMLFAFACLQASAQDAVPTEILRRTIFIKAGITEGTAFLIDHDRKIFLVTARHVVAGLPTTRATIQVRKSGQWVDYQTVKTLFPPSTNADIAVLETNEEVPKQPWLIGIDDTTGSVTMGQQVWFLGYPYGIGSHFSNGDFPFIKRGTMSAIDASNPDAVIIYVDGFNNPGFSGGPVVYWSFSDRKYKIVGVVQGYKNETAKTFLNGVQVDTNILVNSGILIAYSIKHVTQAIEQPSRP